MGAYMWIPVTPRVRGAFQILSVLCISLLAAGIVWADNRQPEVECHDIGGFKYVELDLSDGVGSPENVVTGGAHGVCFCHPVSSHRWPISHSLAPWHLDRPRQFSRRCSPI